MSLVLSDVAEHPLFADIPLTDPKTLPPDEKQLLHVPKDQVNEIITASAHRGVVKLGKKNYHKAIHLGVHAAYLGLHNASAIHYTQGPHRWDWHLAKYNEAIKGEFPRNADCSAYATWVENNALRPFTSLDVVNGADWLYGYTGTQLHHGLQVKFTRRHLDLVFYGTGWPGEHVAIYIGGGLVISHGSEGGPYKLPIDYRSDRMQMRRYIFS